MPNKKERRRLRHERRVAARHARIEAAKAPAELWLSADAVGGITIEAAEDDGNSQLKRFKGIAYTGGAMRPRMFYRDVVVDLSGLTVPSQKRPILMDHDSGKIVGHTDSIAVDGKIAVEGVISGVGAAATEVVGASANGFPWQMSIGATVEKMIAVDEDEKVEVNGRTFTGPILVARKSRLGEVSFVALGADDKTSAKVAAEAAGADLVEAISMDFEKWVEALGLSVDTLTDDQRAKLQAKYDAEQVEPEPKPEPQKKVQAGTDGASVKGDLEAQAGKALESFSEAIDAKLQAAAAEAERQAEVRRICAEYDQPDIAAKALKEKWDTTKTELECLRADRPKAPAAHTHSTEITGAQQEAALLLCASAVPEDELLSVYDEQTMEGARKLLPLSIPTLFNDCIRAAGKTPPRGFSRESIRMAFDASRELQASGFTSATLTTVLGNTANRALLSQYNAYPSTFTQFAGVGSVPNFKQTTRFRLTMTGDVEEVGADGQLKHGSFNEATYTNQATTWGKVVGLTRQMILNDDLDAFLGIPRALGRGCAIALEERGHTVFMGNSGNHFHANNSNLSASSPLDTDPIGSLGKALRLFRNQTDQNSKPIGINPWGLLVPTTLEVVAMQLFSDTEIAIVGTAKASSNAVEPRMKGNTFKGKYRPIVSPWLETSTITGYSTSTWYLVSDPSDVATIEVVYLNGQQTPTLDSSDVDFDQLGMQWRVYFDVGVAYQDPKAAVKCTA